MCLLLIAYKVHPQYPIVLAANRDEYHSRPALTARFWDDKPFLLSGKDLQAGGTWLGITKGGRIAAITNYHEEAITDPTLFSRGSLVADFLCSDVSPRSYANSITHNGLHYGGFSIIFGTVEKLFYCSNRKSDYETCQPGIHGLSNRLLNDNAFKIRKGRDIMKSLLAERDSLSPDDLFSVLNDPEHAPGSELSSHCGTAEDERFYSSIFIRGEEYGTRCSTVILLDRGGHVLFAERSFSPDGKPINTVQYKFTLTPAS